MDVDVIAKLIESSPVVVLVCIAAITVLLRWHHRMDERLREKDDQIIALQRETLQAMHEVSNAVRDLRDALRNERR